MVSIVDWSRLSRLGVDPNPTKPEISLQVTISLFYAINTVLRLGIMLELVQLGRYTNSVRIGKLCLAWDLRFSTTSDSTRILYQLVRHMVCRKFTSWYSSSLSNVSKPTCRDGKILKFDNVLWWSIVRNINNVLEQVQKIEGSGSYQRRRGEWIFFSAIGFVFKGTVDIVNLRKWHAHKMYIHIQTHKSTLTFIINRVLELK